MVEEVKEHGLHKNIILYIVNRQKHKNLFAHIK